MSNVPDYSVVVSYPFDVPQVAVDQVVDRIPGTTVRHTDDGHTDVSTGIGAADTLDALVEARPFVRKVLDLLGTQEHTVTLRPLHV